MIKTDVVCVDKSENWVIPCIQVLGASIVLALMAQIAIPLPFSPIPLSIQTLGVFMIGLTLGSRKGAAAVMTYLVQGTLGLPVFAGGLINPLWFMGPRAGYLIGFVAAAWAIGRFVEGCKRENKIPSFAQVFAALLVGEALILVPGALWLSAYVGMTHAIALGVTPFLSGDLTKIFAATLSFKPVTTLLHKLFDATTYHNTPAPKA